MADAKKPEAKKGTKGEHAYKYYAKEGAGLKRLKKSCPKCGKGYFMGAHKDRQVCGKCGYAEFTGSKEQKPAK